ncbi:uncharacterized protein N7529_000748 [Penicillium soppii]|jgi:hypothetical protein|uniref:uncharacterized protein n=1 Tax=Penicillium soppii TaxID=69789 RepID=UPI002549670A|nr:uncharacterized protein N7529_000748 [Penicillium soppii]KAJ5882076.1 hypothetical protein N7529_000748 [Penicillium soppii]
MPSKEVKHKKARQAARSPAWMATLESEAEAGAMLQRRSDESYMLCAIFKPYAMCMISHDWAEDS